MTLGNESWLRTITPRLPWVYARGMSERADQALRHDPGWTERPLHPALRGLLGRPMIAYDLDTPPASVHYGVPSASGTVILSFDDPLDVGWSGETASERLWTTVAGLHVRPSLIRTHGSQRGIQLDPTPLGFRVLFGAPIAAVAGEIVPLSALPRGISGPEHERLAEVPERWRRLELLESLLLARLHRLDHASIPADIDRAWRLLCAGSGVGETAREVGWSRRHLGTRLTAEIGITPKQLGRVARLSRARAIVRQGSTLADASQVAGYADQSHLSREWRALAGQSPSAEEEFPILHDAGTQRGR